jgi:subtilisin-like proprotein convertase family protein
VRIHRSFIALGAVTLVLGVAVPVQASLQIFCYEGQFHLPIPAAAGTTKGWMNDAVLDVPDHVTIADLDITVTLTHTSVFDLQLFLKGPSGQEVLLNAYDFAAGYLRGGDYNRTIFDDEAATAIQEGFPPFTGRFRPVECLSAFDGQDAGGAWRLQIYDAAYYDTGQLNRFGLSITTTTVAPAPSALALGLIGLGLVRCLSRHRAGEGSDTPATGPGRTNWRNPGS